MKIEISSPSPSVPTEPVIDQVANRLNYILQTTIDMPSHTFFYTRGTLDLTFSACSNTESHCFLLGLLAIFFRNAASKVGFISFGGLGQIRVMDAAALLMFVNQLPDNLKALSVLVS